MPCGTVSVNVPAASVVVLEVDGPLTLTLAPETGKPVPLRTEPWSTVLAAAAAPGAAGDALSLGAGAAGAVWAPAEAVAAAVAMIAATATRRTTGILINPMRLLLAKCRLSIRHDERSTTSRLRGVG